MRVTCWYHTTYSGLQSEPQQNATVEHNFTDAEAERLLELFSSGDWEDGPRCLREILDRYDDGEPLTPHRWVETPAATP